MRYLGFSGTGGLLVGVDAGGGGVGVIGLLGRQRSIIVVRQRQHHPVFLSLEIAKRDKKPTNKAALRDTGRPRLAARRSPVTNTTALAIRPDSGASAGGN